MTIDCEGRYAILSLLEACGNLWAPNHEVKQMAGEGCKAMDSSTEYKEIVRISYDTQASLYAKTLSMQSGNMMRLLGYLLTSGISQSRGNYLDVGCGMGNLAQEIQQRFGGVSIAYCGIDLSQELIKLGKIQNPSLHNMLVGDIEHLPFRDESFDTVISNSVLHWLNVPEVGQSPRRALAEIWRVLRVDRSLAVSVAGIGTGRMFQESYKRVMAQCRFDPGFKAALYREDPVGTMRLDQLINMLLDIGFNIKLALLEYEPVIYSHAAKYLNAVKAYGYGMFLAPVPPLNKEMVWQMIENDFVEHIGDREYHHDQYMIYVIALKPKNNSGRYQP